MKRNAVSSCGPTGLPARRFHEFLLHAGHGELKHGAARFIRIRPEPTAMGFNDGSTDRQSHPYSARLRSVESLENALDIFRINTPPSIAHRYEEALAWVRSVLIDNSRGPF
jgi:hypothetical protein